MLRCVTCQQGFGAVSSTCWCQSRIQEIPTFPNNALQLARAQRRSEAASTTRVHNPPKCWSISVGTTLHRRKRSLAGWPVRFATFFYQSTCWVNRAALNSISVRCQSAPTLSGTVADLKQDTGTASRSPHRVLSFTLLLLARFLCSCSLACLCASGFGISHLRRSLPFTPAPLPSPAPIRCRPSCLLPVPLPIHTCSDCLLISFANIVALSI